jgi:hypothetical protein
VIYYARVNTVEYSRGETKQPGVPLKSVRHREVLVPDLVVIRVKTEPIGKLLFRGECAGSDSETAASVRHYHTQMQRAFHNTIAAAIILLGIEVGSGKKRC